MKKTVICLLVCLLCFSMLVACGGDPQATTASTQTADTTATTGGDNSPTEPNRVLELVKDYETDYRIVVSKNATGYEWNAAYNIRMIILTMTGTSPAIVEDDTAPREKEIVVGANTSRSTLYTVPVDYDGGYCVFISGDRLIVEARSSRGMQLAVQNLGKDCFGVNIAFSDFYKGEELSELTVSASYQKSDVFEVNSFVLVHDDTVYTKRMSYIWMSLLDGLSGTRSFVESEMTAEMPTKNTGAVVIRFVSDDKIADGEWKLHDLGNNSYEVHAADYYGFTAAGRYFKGYVGKNRATEHPYPTSAMGSYLDEGSLSKAEESNAYAFTHTGDIRVMFNNILFHEPSIVQRDYYASLLFSAYKPDVLGLQEVNIGRRGDVEEANGGVIALLAEYGYVETIDPRVQNAYPKTELIPGTDAGLTMGDEYAGQLHPGYGGGKKVEVDGKTFYTYYNHTPLLYNQNTTRYIDGGYYWYLNQWDQRPGQVHDNSASDCGTKSATWGLFEDIETGTRYIVISTHMCTRSEYIRDLQAAEIVALIDQLIEQYDVPVLLGGDYNAAASAESVKILREGGLVNPKTEKLATVHTTSLATTHPEDPVYDTDLKLTVPPDGNVLNTSTKGYVIDHIMVKNHEDMEIFVYGTVFDEMALSSSDHLPLYLDFSVNTAQ